MHYLSVNKAFIGVVLAIVLSVFFIEACRTNSSDTSEEGGEVSYNFDIRPILSDKCFACHGPDANKRRADLRLDIADNAYQALKEHPSMHALVPGSTGQSEVFTRISTKDPSIQMPPPASNLVLSANEIALIAKWIRQGAKYERHWAYTPPKKPELPAVTDKKWPKNEIDFFILHKQEQNKLAPNLEADRERLLKRLSLDVTGLPPTMAMMESFLADTTASAYDRMADSLLSSPRYGEKMATYWLDLARYADSHGYQDDNYRSQWPWRDWVIHAFNENMPYDKFVTWQLAGDLLPGATKEQVLATGFNRNHKITEEGGIIQEEYRIEYVTDRTNTFGKAFLGASLECAHCHDHKFDPFSQKEYYQVFSFFNNVKEKGIEGGTENVASFAKNPLIEITNEDVKTVLRFINKRDTTMLKMSVMGEEDTVRKTYVLKRGVYDAHGDSVTAGTPKAILAFDSSFPKNRYGLSQWLFDKRNPLTARVFVNQVWQEFFGRGIVKTTSDFGMQGALPSHPQLLDWLATDFMEHGWNVKRLVKQLVSSSTYRQSSVITPEKLKEDPDNILLARASRHRVKAELVRDIVLASSGLLVNTIGGPSVKPYQPKGLWETATSGRGILATYLQDRGENLYRRGLYTFIKRTVLPPSMSIFDASKRDVCETGRLTTNTPLQALVMMNDPLVLEASRVLAANLLHEKTGVPGKIAKAFRLIICRVPKKEELSILADLYDQQLKTLDKKKAEQLLAVGEYSMPDDIEHLQLAAMMEVVSAIYNMEEAISRS